MKRGASDYVTKGLRQVRRPPLTIEQVLRAQQAEQQRPPQVLAESSRRYRELGESLEETVRQRTARLRKLAAQPPSLSATA